MTVLHPKMWETGPARNDINIGPVYGEGKALHDRLNSCCGKFNKFGWHHAHYDNYHNEQYREDVVFSTRDDGATVLRVCTKSDSDYGQIIVNGDCSVQCSQDDQQYMALLEGAKK